MARFLCYGCLPSIFDSIRSCEGSMVIVVSPLLALMKDKVESFRKKRIVAKRSVGRGTTSHKMT